jgi:hypothetical protein
MDRGAAPAGDATLSGRSTRESSMAVHRIGEDAMAAAGFRACERGLTSTVYWMRFPDLSIDPVLGHRSFSFTAAGQLRNRHDSAHADPAAPDSLSSRRFRAGTAGLGTIGCNPVACQCDFALEQAEYNDARRRHRC